jgi:hypothetical protein
MNDLAIALLCALIAAAAPVSSLPLAGDRPGIRPGAPSAGGVDIFLPALLRNTAADDLPVPVTAVPSATTAVVPTSTVSPAPTHTTGPSPTPTSTPTPTATAPPHTPGVPGCQRTTGDAGGFRFSLDGGAVLAPNARRLANIAYTWDLDVDPRDGDVILEVHQGRLFRSLDAGCTFAEMPGVPAGDWDRLTRAPSDPDVLVLTSVFASRVAFTADGGQHWTVEDLPDDVMDLAVDPSDSWHWTFVGRGPAINTRTGPAERWTARPIPLDAGQSVISAAYAPSRPDRWLVASATRGIYRTDDSGETWRASSEGLFAPVGDPSEPTLSVVVASVTFAPSDPDVAYATLNQVGRNQSLRGLWRSADGGSTWSLRVRDDDPVGTTLARITGGTRVFVSPTDPDWTFFAFGMAYDGYGTDLFRSRDGLRTLDVSHFADFYEIYAMAFGPRGSPVVFVGASSDIPSE